MPVPLPDDITEARPEAVTHLGHLLTVVEQIASTTSVVDRMMARRLHLWRTLRQLDPPVSWANMARASGVSEVTIIQAVQGRGSKKQGRVSKAQAS